MRKDMRRVVAGVVAWMRIGSTLEASDLGRRDDNDDACSRRARGFAFSLFCGLYIWIVLFLESREAAFRREMDNLPFRLPEQSVTWFVDVPLYLSRA